MDDAVYVAATDKIYGVSGPYVMQFNATTGARENIVKVTSPSQGISRIVYHTANGLLYVSTWLDLGWVDIATTLSSPRSTIFPVTTGLVVGAPFNMMTLFGGQLNAGPPLGLNGPLALVSDGIYIYLSWRFQTGGGQIARFDPTNTPDNATNFLFGWNSWNSMDFAVGVISGTNSAIFTDPNQQRLRFGNATLAGFTTSINLTTNAETPVACVYDGSFIWAVCGNGVLIGGNPVLLTYTAGDPADIPNYNASFNLETAATPSPIPTPLRPYRIRLRQIGPTQFLYIAVPNQDLIVIRNQATGALSWKGGFDSPIDCVFTPTKAFAVQQGPVSLKEIV